MYEDCPENLKKLITRLSSASGRHGEVRSDRALARQQSKRVASARNQLHDAIALELRMAFRAGAELKQNASIRERPPKLPPAHLDRKLQKLQDLGAAVRRATRE